MPQGPEAIWRGGQEVVMGVGKVGEGIVEVAAGNGCPRQDPLTKT